MKKGKTAFVVGLDVARSFDRASLIRLAEAPLNYGVPTSICAVIGAWRTGRSLKIKLRSPLGAVCCED